MKVSKQISFLLLVPTLAFGLAACSQQNSGTVAQYGKQQKITQSQFYQELKKSPSSKTVLANLLIYDALNAKYGHRLQEKTINHEYQQYKSRYGSQFSTFLAQNSYSPASFKRMLKINQLSNIALRDQMKPNQAQLKKEWRTYRPDVKIQHILTSSKTTARKVVQKLNSGSSFAKLAQQYSIDSATSTKGGRMTVTMTNSQHLDSNVKHAAYTLKVGKYTRQPISTSNGYEIVKVVARPSKGSFASHQQDLRKLVYEQWATNPTIMRNVISQVLKEEKVKITDKDLSSALDEYKGSTTSGLH